MGYTNNYKNRNSRNDFYCVRVFLISTINSILFPKQTCETQKDD